MYNIHKGDDFMYCKGHNRRVQICKEWDVNPIAHLKLLQGRIVKSDAGGGNITDTYVLFECINKKNHNLKDTIYCSPTTAKDFCDINGVTLPPLFNPLHQQNHGHGSNKHINSKDKKWNPCRKQLYNIVMVIFSYLGTVEKDSVLFHIKQELEDTRFIDYYPKKQARSINSYLSKMGTTFKKIIDELAINNDLRDFKYDLVVEYIKKLGLDQHIY